MSSTITTNLDVALRTQLDYYGQGRYDLAEEVITVDYVDHEAPRGTPAGPDGANAVLWWAARRGGTEVSSDSRGNPPRA